MRRKLNIQQNIMLFIMVGVSILTSLLVLFDIDKPSYYHLLPLLPLTFAVATTICYSMLSIIPDNIGVSGIVFLFFVRDVISPLFLFFGDYSATITKNIQYNTDKAVLLVVYETLAVFAVMFILFLRSGKEGKVNENIKINRINKRNYGVILIALLAILILCIFICPDLLRGYRTIFQLANPLSTTLEDAYVVQQYGQSFITKLSLVLGQYLMRILLIVVPAYFMVVLSNKATVLSKLVSFCCCFIPTLFIGGTIARSLIYVFSLFLLFVYLQPNRLSNFLIVGIAASAVIVIVIWWIYRASFLGSFNSIIRSFSERFSAYFSGVNVVSGTFNLPNNVGDKIHYFLYDYLGSIPFGTTLFGLYGSRIAEFFNLCSESSGQIPTTIGMGYYYFGYVLAPLYSSVFACIAYVSGKKIITETNSFAKIRWILMAIYFTLGIVMYNIEITLSTVFSLLLPLYLVEILANNKRGIINDN